MSGKRIQYTLRNIPERVDACVRETAAEYGSSLNETALNLLAKGAGVASDPVRNHDLDDLAGTWVKDEACEKALDEMRQVDEELWR